MKKKTLLKSLLYFGEWNFLFPSLKNVLILETNLQDLKIKQKIYPKKFLVSSDVFVIFIAFKA